MFWHEQFFLSVQQMKLNCCVGELNRRETLQLRKGQEWAIGWNSGRRGETWAFYLFCQCGSLALRIAWLWSEPTVTTLTESRKREKHLRIFYCINFRALFGVLEMWCLVPVMHFSCCGMFNLPVKIDPISWPYVFGVRTGLPRPQSIKLKSTFD